MICDWRVPRAWPGETVFILCGGPSLAGQGVERLRRIGARVIAINSSIYDAEGDLARPWVDYVFSGDIQWLREHEKVLRKHFDGRVVTYATQAAWPGLKRLKKLAPGDAKHPGRPHISDAPDTVVGNRTSLQAAINIVWHLCGATRIVLLGADGGRDASGRSHHHKAHPWPVKKGCWDEQHVELKAMMPALEQRGLVVVNASPGTHWADLWPVTTLDAVLAEMGGKDSVPAVAAPEIGSPRAGPAAQEWTGPATAYAVPGEHSGPRFAEAWAKGCGGSVETGGALLPGPIALFGSPKRWDLLHQAIAEGRDWYYCDHGYFGRMDGGTLPPYYRVTRNAFQHSGRDPRVPGVTAPERVAALGLSVAPWREDGDHVLVCPPDAGFARLMRFDAGAWSAHVFAALREITNRPIIWRDRAAEKSGRALAEDLVGAWCLVTYVSNAAVEAVLAGVPVICTGPCAARTMGSGRLADVADPPRPTGRERWAEILAANQWTLDEIWDGAAARHFGLSEQRSAAA